MKRNTWGKKLEVDILGKRKVFLYCKKNDGPVQVKS